MATERCAASVTEQEIYPEARVNEATNYDSNQTVVIIYQ
jgi:hypothetical protein